MEKRVRRGLPIGPRPGRVSLGSLQQDGPRVVEYRSVGRRDGSGHVQRVECAIEVVERGKAQISEFAPEGDLPHRVGFGLGFRLVEGGGRAVVARLTVDFSRRVQGGERPWVEVDGPMVLSDRQVGTPESTIPKFS